jgi:hypothetical protein
MMLNLRWEMRWEVIIAEDCKRYYMLLSVRIYHIIMLSDNTITNVYTCTFRICWPMIKIYINFQAYVVLFLIRFSSISLIASTVILCFSYVSWYTLANGKSTISMLLSFRKHFDWRKEHVMTSWILCMLLRLMWTSMCYRFKLW